nr:hypothetical protein CFP56_57683 [Quercus suber]
MYSHISHVSDLDPTAVIRFHFHADSIVSWAKDRCLREWRLQRTPLRQRSGFARLSRPRSPSSRGMPLTAFYPKIDYSMTVRTHPCAIPATARMSLFAVIFRSLWLRSKFSSVSLIMSTRTCTSMTVDLAASSTTHVDTKWTQSWPASIKSPSSSDVRSGDDP